MENNQIEIIELDGDSMENPIYESHKRGRNWVAILTGKNAANMNRDFLKARGEVVDLAPVAAGAVLEIAGDYTSSGGVFRPNRLYWRVLVKSDDEMTVEVYASAAKALKAARLASVTAAIAA